jgi:DmsE family decaheme c-type cytochrome
MYKLIKALLICGFILSTIIWTSFDNSSQSAPFNRNEQAQAKSDDYVGSEACKDCHEDQFKNFSHTSHAQLTKIGSWKNKVTGCESCHGPGKAHIEEGDPKKIISFKNKSSKETSETCLACHSGREEHNNFRRGEHWRNDIGCTDCHSTHSPTRGRQLAASNVFVSSANAQKPGLADLKLLRNSEPQLCMGCHSETKHQFNLPFHHKVLEGAMKCSDCHNPHGGFELKQTRLATGADAACIKCHADKQGPFVYEHAPVKTDGCIACHTPHGSSNPRLLITSRVAQLCLTCHSASHGVGADEPAGPQHNLNAQYANCTNCHIKIHGSRTSPVFFR